MSLIKGHLSTKVLRIFVSYSEGRTSLFVEAETKISLVFWELQRKWVARLSIHLIGSFDNFSFAEMMLQFLKNCLYKLS